MRALIIVFLFCLCFQFASAKEIKKEQLLDGKKLEYAACPISNQAITNWFEWFRFASDIEAYYDRVSQEVVILVNNPDYDSRDIQAVEDFFREYANAKDLKIKIYYSMPQPVLIPGKCKVKFDDVGGKQ